MNRKRWTTGLLLFFFCLMLHNAAGQSYAAEQEFNEPKTNVINNIDFINGDFMIPDIDDPSAWSEDCYATYEESRKGRYQLYHMDKVPGWQTRPTYPKDEGNRWAEYIEIQGVVEAVIGDQYAELNGNVPGMLYQICTTTPGQKIYYEFSHRGRNGVDTMNFYLFNKNNGAPAAGDIIRTCVTGNTAWQHFKGSYRVPEGQTSTVFAFQSTSGSNVEGNFLDAISLHYPSFLEMESAVTTSGTLNNPVTSSVTGGSYKNYALPGEILTSTITLKNTGETDSSRTVLTNVIPEGVDFLGSVKINGQDAGNLAVFDNASRTLTMNLGTDAEAVSAVNNEQNGGKVAQDEEIVITYQVKVLDDAEAGSIIENQAKITYNDDQFEDYNLLLDDQGQEILDPQGNPVIVDETNYSTISGFIIVPNMISGSVYIDSDNNGIIDASERLASGWEVTLRDSSNNIVLDINGDELKTITGADGIYELLWIPAGTVTDYYYVTVTHPGYQTSAATGTGAADNKAVAYSGDSSQIAASFTGVKQIYENQHLGVVPVMRTAKTARIDNLPEETGSKNNPVIFKRDQELVYMISITNEASEDAIKAVTVMDEIPDGLAIKQMDPVAGSAVSGQMVTWADQEIPPLSTVIYYIYTEVDTSGAGALEQLYKNQATVTSVWDTQKTNATWHQLEETGSLEIKKEVDKVTGNAERFLFLIEQYDKDGMQLKAHFYGVVELDPGDLSSTTVFIGLSPGQYRITEVSSNWRYQLRQGDDQTRPVSILTFADQNSYVLFNNEFDGGGWLGSGNKAVNYMEQP